MSDRIAKIQQTLMATLPATPTTPGNPSRRALMKAAGASLLMMVSPTALASASSLLAVRVWPANGTSRITLESACLRAPFAITCTIYGWAYHTRFLADEATALDAYAEMKAALGDIVALLPQDDDDIPANADQIEQAVTDFAERFP